MESLEDGGFQSEGAILVEVGEEEPTELEEGFRGDGGGWRGACGVFAGVFRILDAVRQHMLERIDMVEPLLDAADGIEEVQLAISFDDGEPGIEDIDGLFRVGDQSQVFFDSGLEEVEVVFEGHDLIWMAGKGG